MIISENPVPPSADFELLLAKSHEFIANAAKETPNYFCGRTPLLFEEDVYAALTDSAKDTPFDDSIRLISGHKFPDIVANGFYGVEVKSTTGAKWKSVGNSVREGTRVENVERIYLFFGQLIKPAVFKWRLYQDCLYDVAVTHSPRYLIDMELHAGETVFDRIGYKYDALRKLDNPIKPVVDYYKKESKRGEEPWWIGAADETVPLTVRLWGNLSVTHKQDLVIQAMSRFPEIFSKSSGKYKNCAAWLAARHGVVSTSLRDSFSAGGKVDLQVGTKVYSKMPHVFKHLQDNISSIKKDVLSLSVADIRRYWNVDADDSINDAEKIKLWAEVLVLNAKDYIGSDHTFLHQLLSGDSEIL